jgi:hypothetical protein
MLDYTPGPWEVIRADEEDGWQYEVCGHEADDDEREGQGHEGHVLAAVFYTAHSDDRAVIRDGLDNARIMAAGPSLYEFVLRRAVEGDAEAVAVFANLGLDGLSERIDAVTGRERGEGDA